MNIFKKYLEKFRKNSTDLDLIKIKLFFLLWIKNLINKFKEKTYLNKNYNN